MKMFLAYGKRVRVSTTVKAYIDFTSGMTFSQVADKYAKGNHLFLDAMLKFVNTNLGYRLAETTATYNNELFELIGTEYKKLKDDYLRLQDDLIGKNYKVKYHYNTSHNTRSKSLYTSVKAISRQRAQQLALKKLGGDAVIIDTKEIVQLE